MAFGGFGGGGNKPLFGQQSAPAFGVSAFGATSGTGLFGSSTPATGPAGAFGATAPPAQGSGLFGAAQQQQQQQQQQPSGFGATSGFGAGAQSSGFGAGAQGFGGFGAQSSSAFGGGGGFGAQSGSGFGGFGAQSSSAFGGGGGGGGGFGAQSGSGFGGFGGGFGAQQQQQQQTPPGTRAVKYQITSDITSGAGSEGKYIAITAMPAYAAKSIEELRIEDYLKNDRGGPNPAAAGTGLFGSAPPAASPFAQQPQSTPALFGAAPAKPSLFAQAQSAAGLFGTAASGSAPLFGQSAPAQSGAGLFGAAPQSAPSIFGGGATGGAATFGSGATAAPAGFGAAPQTGLFGQSGGALFGGGGAAISGPGLFGASAPGATTQATGSSIFGPKPSTGTSLFGAPASGGALFGGGSGGGSGGGLFGSSGSAFGAKPPGALFGSSGQTSGGLFGTTPQSSGGLFGTTPQASGGLFGSTPQSSGGLFGPSGGGLFGGGFRANSGSAFGGGGFGGSGAFGMPSGFGAFGTQQAAPAPLQASVNIDPFGSSQLYAHAEQALRQAGITADGVKTEEGAAAKPTVVVGQVRAGPYSRAHATAARGPGAFESARRALGADLFRTAPNANGATFRMGSTTRPQARFADSGRPRHSLAPWRTPKQALRAATIKKLVIEPLPTTSDVSSLDGRASSVANGRHVPTAAARGTVRFEKGDAIMPPEPAHESADEEEVTVADVENSTVEVLDLRRDPSVPKPTPRYLVGQARADDGTPQVYSKYSEFYKANVASPRRRRSIERARRREAEEREAEEASPPFTKRLDIETRPSLDELAQMSPEELRCVKDFAVVRQGIGQVQWYGETDVTGLDIDRVVDLRFREIRVYPLEEECPPVGTGLNKRAVVKLHGIWKKDRASRMPMKDSRAAENMIVKLKLHCEKEGLRFIGYEVGSGTWTFEAQRF